MFSSIGCRTLRINYPHIPEVYRIMDNAADGSSPDITIIHKYTGHGLRSAANDYAFSWLLFTEEDL